MARPRTVDRERLLDAAESCVAAGRIAALTFGSVAAAAGVPKASVQSAFRTREGMIDAMLERWLGREQQRFERAAGTRPSARKRMQAHLETTEEEETGSRMATLLAALAGSGEQSASTAAWYVSRIGSLTAKTSEQRRLRIAFLAAEGAFYIRHLVGFPIDDSLWHELFKDLRAFIDEQR